MMSLKICTRAHFFNPLSISPSKLNVSVSRGVNLRRKSSSPIRMSTKSQIIEHVVLLKVKPNTDESKIASMINGLNGLISLDQVIHMTAGAVHRTRSSSLKFTHMLHSRYKSKDDLDAYAVHPAHVSVVNGSVKPIVEDAMAVDWIGENLEGAAAPAAGSAMRLTFMKVKEGSSEKESDEVLEVIGGIKEKFPAINQLSFGKNFSPERAKGYSIASLAVFPSLKELDELDSDSDSNSELANSQKAKARDLLESVLVLDYVIQPQLSSSL